MTYRVSILVIICILLSPYVVYSEPPFILKADKGKNIEFDRNILIVYHDSWGIDIEKFKMLYLTLRSFSSKLDIIKIDDFASKNFKDKNVVVILGSRNFPYKDAFDEDLNDFKGEIIWCGSGFGKYKKIKERFADYFYAKTSAILEYLSEGQSAINSMIPIESGFVLINNSNADLRWGSIIYNNRKYPYAALVDNVSIISGFYNDLTFKIFSDILSYLLGDKEVLSEKQIYIMISNIGPFSDLDRLESISKWLIEQKVPFIVELVPVFENENLRYMGKYIEVLKKMLKSGGTPVLGNLKGFLAPKDFWSREVAITQDTKDDILAKEFLYKAFKVYLTNGIYPIGFSGSPDMFFSEEYAGVLNFFDLFIQSKEWKVGKQQIFNYQTSWRGNFLSMLYCKDNPYSNVISKNLLRLTESLPKTAVFDLETDESVDFFKNSIKEFKEHQFDILDLKKSYISKVNIKDINLLNIKGEIYLNSERVCYFASSKTVEEANKNQSENISPGRKRKENLMLRRFRYVIGYVLEIVGGFIVIFVIAFIINKRIDRKKHLR